MHRSHLTALALRKARPGHISRRSALRAAATNTLNPERKTANPEPYIHPGLFRGAVPRGQRQVCGGVSRCDVARERIIAYMNPKPKTLNPKRQVCGGVCRCEVAGSGCARTCRARRRTQHGGADVRGMPARLSLFLVGP
jgi:hypothetical protein